MRSHSISLTAALSSLILAGLSGQGQAAPRRAPQGSYQASCVGISLSNSGLLTAQCRTAAGRMNASSLRMPDCGKGDISNINGQLTCPPLFVDRPRPPGRGPGPGPGRGPGRGPGGPASLTLYENIEFKGRTVEVNGDAPNLDLMRFNDRASSIRVNGGRWQVCVDAQFRGRCTILDKDSPNLSRFSLNDRISSVRRMG